MTISPWRRQPLTLLWALATVAMVTAEMESLTIRMPGVNADKDDDYMCIAKPAPQVLSYITSFDAKAKASRAHHMLIMGCKEPLHREGVWHPCHEACKSGETTLFGWGKNASPTHMPKDVGFAVGPGSKVNYIVLQVHYKLAMPAGAKDSSGFVLQLTTQKPHYIAGIYVLIGTHSIPPHQKSYGVDTSCVFTGETPIHPFAYRVHAHSLGVVVSGYFKNSEGKVRELAKGNPQWPQSFYPMNTNYVIKKGDKIAARCTYNSLHKDVTTVIGEKHTDEMCNLYIMYYKDRAAHDNDLGLYCVGDHVPSLSAHLPADAMTPLPPNNHLLRVAEGRQKASKNIYLTADKRGHSGVDGDDETEMELRMPGVTPDQDDDYWCTFVEAPKETSFITGFEALSENSRAHHMLLFGCTQPAQRERQAWKCMTACESGESVIFAWAKNADPAHLPKDVGFKVGPKSSVRYIVLQVHYKDALPPSVMDHSGYKLTLTTQRPLYAAGIFLFLGVGSIPPHQKAFGVDVTCRYVKETSIFPFAFRVHAHTLSTVISGYHDNGTLHQMAKGNPQWPQAFYPMEETFEIKKGDKLAARCTYDTSNKDTITRMGHRHTDEMCNLYVMYYTNRTTGQTYQQCAGDMIQTLSARIPADSLVPLPPNPRLDDIAAGNVQEIDEVSGWPTSDLHLGEVAGVSMDTDGNLVVFHRGSRKWEPRSFTDDNIFRDQQQPITEQAVLTLATSDGRKLSGWGEDMFYMPHGLHIDHRGNVWVTDVALHMVMRFPRGQHTPDLQLGERFVPGTDAQHFCKPTDVATLSTGEFYVTDGYCNSRVMKFSADGKLLKQWGTQSSSMEGSGFPPPSSFALPHSVAALEASQLICVADRNNDRVQCFDLEGRYRRQMATTDRALPIYGVRFCPDNGLLYAVTGIDFYHPHGKMEGIVFNPHTGEQVETWTPTSKPFENLHDLAVTSDCKEIYVGEIGPNRLWKFNVGKPQAGAATSAQRAPPPQAPPPQAPPPHPISSDADSPSDSVDKQTLDEQISNTAAPGEFGPSLIIGGLLVGPVVVIVIVTVCVRLRRSGRCAGVLGGRHNNRRLDLGTLLSRGRHQFSPLATDDDKDELDHLQSDDDDIDEFTLHGGDNKA